MDSDLPTSESNDGCAADPDYIYESDPDDSESEFLVSRHYPLPARETRYCALGKRFKVLTMEVSTDDLDDMIHEAELHVSDLASSGADLSEDIERHRELPGTFPKRQPNVGQGKSTSAKKRKHRQAKIQEAQLRCLHDQQQEGLLQRKRARISEHQITETTVRPTSRPYLTKTDRRNLRHTRHSAAREKKEGLCASKKAIHAVAQQIGELQFGIDMEEEIETGTQLGTYRPRYQPVDNDIKQRIGAINQARKKGIPEDPVVVIRSLQAQNYRVIKWDGVRPIALVDCQDRIFTVLVGQPREKSWAERCKSLFSLLAHDSEKVQSLGRKHREHRRGFYPTIDNGVTFAPGDKHAHNLTLSDTARQLAEDPTRASYEDDCQRFAESAMSVFAPDLFRYYREHIKLLHTNQDYGHLRHNTRNGIYTSKSKNYPPGAVTVPHRDVMNLAFGWCAVFALGNFDAIAGGHLVIHNLRVAIEFPHASCILLPSSILWHSNVPIRPNEERASLTFYTPGSLFRFIDNHFLTEEKLKEVNEEEWKRLQEEKVKRKKYAYDFYSTVQEITSPARYNTPI